MMLQGICPQCGTTFYGWALKSPEHQDCTRCGSWLDIIEEQPPEYQPVQSNLHTPDNIHHILKETNIDRWLDS